jgi:hypothetical protein
MTYTDRFKLTDDLIEHLDPVLTSINDPFIESRYTGFLAVSSVTVLELAIKDIFQEFADSVNPILGCFCAKYFERINGRIGLESIRKDYLTKFGADFLAQFKARLEEIEAQHLRGSGESVKSSYDNLIVWRHQFAHQGEVPTNASYRDVKKAFACAKIVLACLADSMKSLQKAA